MKKVKFVLVFFILIGGIVYIINLFNTKFSYDNLMKQELNSKYGLNVIIEDRKETDDEIEYQLKAENGTNVFNCNLKKLNSDFFDRSYELTVNIDDAIKKDFFDILKKEHENLVFDNGCYVLEYEDYSDVENASLAVQHIADYMNNQKYFSQTGNIGFIRVEFKKSISDETSTEFCYGIPSVKQEDYYLSKLYHKESTLERIKDKYLEITSNYGYQDSSVPSELYNKIQLVSNGERTAKIENYKGYFTFEQALKAIQDMGYKTFGDAESFSVFVNDDIYEFSKLFIDGPHTYYIYNGDHYTLANQENIISEEVMNKIIGKPHKITFESYGSINKVYLKQEPIGFIFGVDKNTEEPYLYLTELPKLFDILKINYNKDDCSLYKYPLYEWQLNGQTYTFDLSYSKYYRHQLGEFVSNDDEYYIKNDEIQFNLPEFSNNHFNLQCLSIITGYEFSYDKANNSIYIN